jgi:uncharacterized membrane protein YhdT
MRSSILQYAVFASVGLFYSGALLFLGGATAGFKVLSGAVLVVAVTLFTVASALSIFRARAGAATGAVCAGVLAIWSGGVALFTGSALGIGGVILILPSLVAFGTGMYGVRAADASLDFPRWLRIAIALLPVGLLVAYLSWLIPRLTWDVT